MNEIFFEFKEVKPNNDLSSDIIIEIILHFLSKVEEAICLFETKLNIIKQSNLSIGVEVINKLQEVFNISDTQLKLVKGKVREIFLSYSS